MMKVLCTLNMLTLLILIQSLLFYSIGTADPSTHITMEGDKPLEQKEQSDAQKVDVSTESDHVKIHINNQGGAMENVPNIEPEASTTNEEPEENECQAYIDIAKKLKTLKNKMAVDISALELKIKRLQKKQSEEHEEVTVDSNEGNGTNSSAETDETEGEEKGGGMDWLWNPWVILIFAILLLIPLLVLALFYFCQKEGDTENEEEHDDNEEKQNNGDFPFILNEPDKSTENNDDYTREVTNDDIDKLGNDLDGYFGNGGSSKPTMTTETNPNDPNDKNDNKPKPVMSSEAKS